MFMTSNSFLSAVNKSFVNLVFSFELHIVVYNMKINEIVTFCL